MRYPIELTYDPSREFEPEPDKTCAHCRGLFFDYDLTELSSTDKVCEACKDKAPWHSDCCGYEVSGIDFTDLDYQICGDCRDHCEYVK